jgi:membrane protein required for colicin V production
MEGFFIQPYDLLMLGVLVGLAVLGAWKGVAWQIAALSSLVVSWLVAVRFGKVLAPFISDNEPWNGFIAMLLLYLGTSLAIWSFFRLVKGMIDRVQLKDFDRQMGALFGLVKGALWCLLITFFAVTLSDTTRQWVLQSRSGYYTALLIQHGTPALPEDVRNVLGKYIKQLDEGLEEGHLEESMAKTPVSDPRQGRGDLASEIEQLQSEAVTNFRDEAEEFLNSRAGELERGIDERGAQIQGDIHEAMRRGFNELDSQIKRLPLEPVRR